MATKSKVTTAPTKLLTAEDFFSSSRPKLITLTTIPGQVYLRPLPAGDVLAFMEQRAAKDDSANHTMALMKLISCAVLNEDGSRVFAEDNLDRLKDIPVLLFNELAEVVLEAAGIAVVAAGKEDEGKGSSAASTTASSTV